MVHLTVTFLYAISVVHHLSAAFPKLDKVEENPYTRGDTVEASAQHISLQLIVEPLIECTVCHHCVRFNQPDMLE